MSKYLCKPSTSSSSQPNQGSDSVDHPGAEAGATAQSLSAVDDGKAAGLAQEPGGDGEDSSVKKKFMPKWLQLYPNWLRRDEEKDVMYCELCRSNGLRIAWLLVLIIIALRP